MLVLVGLLTLAAPDMARVTSTPVQGSIEASLARAEPEAGPALAAQVARLLRWRGDVVKNVHRGDLLSIVWELGADGPELVAIDYAGESIDLRAYRFDGGDGILRYWDETGALVEPRLVRSPVESYVQITEVKQRGRGKRRHQGLDLKAPTGTPIRLPWGAVVSRVNWSRRINGNCVEVRYSEGAAGVTARYLHLDSIDPAVVAGVRLEAGALLGTVGSTGRSSAAHLHYELNDDAGTVLDALLVHGTERVRLDAAQSEPFAAARARSDAGLPRRAMPSAATPAGALAAPAE